MLPDVNVLVHAHRADSPNHARCRTALDEHDLALTPATLNGFLRLVTANLFNPPTPPNTALAVVTEWLARPETRLLGPGPDYWSIYSGLCRRHQVTSGDYYDVHLAALAIENGIELWSLDAGFGRFDGLRWRNPIG